MGHEIMKRRPDSLTYIVFLFVLIIVAAISSAIINAVKNNTSSPADIRARAGVVDIVKLTGTVASVDETNGIVTISNVQLAPESRTGPAVNYGTWTVTPPRTFTLSSARIGAEADFVINSDSFNVASKQVIASQMSVR